MIAEVSAISKLRRKIMTSENMPQKVKNPLCSMKSCICDAIQKTKSSYFECDFDIGEKIHSGDSENPEISMFKNGTIKLRIFDIILVSAIMGAVCAVCKLLKK